MDNSIAEKCLLCFEDCEASQIVINLTSQKYKNPYTQIIKNFIKDDYELSIDDSNKICGCCQDMCEKYDELDQEARKIKSVLSLQLASIYELETDEVANVDISQKFQKIGTKFKCVSCPQYSTVNSFSAQAHVIYHELLLDQRKTLKDPLTVLNSKIQPPKSMRYSDESYPEEEFKKLIDLDNLLDPSNDENVKAVKCAETNCTSKFSYISDYARHLRYDHKITSNQIYQIIKAYIKKPKRMRKLTCPFCFTILSSESELRAHVYLHENKCSTDALVNDIIQNSLCEICGLKREETAMEVCHHLRKTNPKIDCSICDAYFYDKKLYNNHLVFEHLQCFVCKSRCNSRNQIFNHLQMHIIKEIKCPALNCKNISLTSSSHKKHLKMSHSLSCCPQCGEFFNDITFLEDHVRFSHANLRAENNLNICDACGMSFGNPSLLQEHIKLKHEKRKNLMCSICESLFQYRYTLIDHMSKDHGRKVIDNDLNFYKCFLCPKTFVSVERAAFLTHINGHDLSSKFCIDCNQLFSDLVQYENHRSECHLDFTILLEKVPLKQRIHIQESLKKSVTFTQHEPGKPESSKIEVEEHQQIFIRTEDGNIVAMNNFMLNDNGELVIQNIDRYLENGEGSELHIDNIEQYLVDQGFPESSGISCIQTENGQLMLQTDDQVQNVQDFNISGNSDVDVTTIRNNGYQNDLKVTSKVVEKPKIGIVAPSNQSTLDELGDILLEVAAAADQTITPRSSNLQSCKRNKKNHNSEKKRKMESEVNDFSQAYEVFIQTYDKRFKNV